MARCEQLLAQARALDYFTSAELEDTQTGIVAQRRGETSSVPGDAGARVAGMCCVERNCQH
jgi:hypothetical protein